MNALSVRQIRAVTALAESDSISAAADTCGVNRATLHRWMRLPQFIDALAEIQADHRSRAVRRLSSALDRAAQRVIDLADHAEDESVQLRAAMAVPQMLRELLELESANTPAPLVIDAPKQVLVFDHAAVVRSIAAASDARYREDQFEAAA